MKWNVYRFVVDVAAALAALILVWEPTNALSTAGLAAAILFATVSTALRPAMHLLTMPVILLLNPALRLGLTAATLLAVLAAIEKMQLNVPETGIGHLIAAALVIASIRVSVLAVIHKAMPMYQARKERAWIRHLEHYREWLIRETAGHR